MRTELVFTKKQQAVTTSLLVAKKFEKRHDSVLRAIRNLDCSDDFRQRNFVFMVETNELPQGGASKSEYYIITQDGFTLLAFGFTGKKAAAFKESYIDQFNQMREAIFNHKDGEWLQARKQGKLIRKKETDIIQAFVEYATEQGSKNAQMYYMNITKMTNKALSFLVQVKEGSPIRDLLEIQEHFFVGILDNRASQAIQDGMDSGMYYKDIYKYAKDEVNHLANSMKFKPRLKAG